MPTGTLTAIIAQARDSQRVNLFIDGTFAIGVSLNLLAREGLAVGQVIDEPIWTRLEQAAASEHAFQAALRLLATRPRATAELRERLRRKQHPPEALEAALSRLSELGLLDDAAFSRAWIENRQRLSPRGRQALRAELRQKGVDRTTIDAALAAVEADPEGEQARAEELARGVLHRYRSSPDRATFQRRLGGMLMRRGFSLEVIRPILAILWDETRPGDHADENEP